MEFLVEWVIDIDADSHEEAARQAHKFMLDPESTATTFFVTGPDDCGKATTIEVP